MKDILTSIFDSLLFLRIMSGRERDIHPDKIVIPETIDPMKILLEYIGLPWILRYKIPCGNVHNKSYNIFIPIVIVGNTGRMPTKLSTRTRGTVSYDAETMRVHVCTAINPGDKNRQDAADGVQHALDQLYNAGAIPGYEIELWDTDCSLTCDSTILTQWEDYRYTHQKKLTGIGCWLLVHDCGTSIADGAGTAWGDDLDAMVKTDHYAAGTATFQSVAVQEVWHTFTHQRCSYVDSMTSDSEHSLGDEMYESSIGQYVRTPMCSTYPGEIAEGNCNDEFDYVEYSDSDTYLNQCEIDAIQYYRDHYFGRHS